MKAKKERSLDEDVNLSLALLSQGVEKKERRNLLRSLRYVSSIRKKLNGESLAKVVSEVYPSAQEYLDLYVARADTKSDNSTVEDVAMEKEEEAETEKEEKTEEAIKNEEEAAKKAEEARIKQEENDKKLRLVWGKIPEVQVFVHLLVTLLLLDNNQIEEACRCSEALLHLLQTHNRRSMDLLSAKVFYYFALAHERSGRLASIRETLILAHRTACLQHNEPGQAALVCCILRNYLHYKLYSQADKFRLNSTFPETRSNNFYARYLYYMGQINSVQLHYSEAYANLSQAIRKAPNSARGFRIRAHKLMVIVQLLMGEVPERSIFLLKDLQADLKPYFQLTQAVRVGNLADFEAAETQHKAQFQADGIFSLMVRLRNNVIKTGLRKINTSYSRISLQDICDKLKLPSLEDAAHIVAKAIHDGVIDAVIDRKEGFMFSRENNDIYSTHEPQLAFHKRIQFCMEIHNNAVKSLRFPRNAHKSQAGIDAEQAAKSTEEEVKAALAEEED